MNRTIVEESSKNIAIMDVFSKLAQDRIIFIDGVITQELANSVIAQMLYLDSIDEKKITIFINSYGGSVYDGLAIYDIIMKLKSPIRTVCVGVAASMSGIILLAGSERAITRHGRVMLHQPSSYVGGKHSDIEIDFEELSKLKNELYNIIKERSLVSNPDELYKNDFWYNSEEALKEGIVTEIL